MMLYTLVIATVLANGQLVRTENRLGAASQETCRQAASEINSQGYPKTFAYCYISGHFP